MTTRHLTRWATALLLLVAAFLTACAGDDASESDSGLVVITCAACQESPTDPFLQFNYEAVQRFNEANEGKYRVKVVQNQYASSGPDRLQYYQRLALADDLPDVFLVNRAELESLAKTHKLLDFAPALEEDSAWKDSFYEGAFDALAGDDGQVWAVPQQRDAIGIYYNTRLFRDAGIDEFPTTWAEFREACAQIKAAGKICFAMDGDWVTLLMWANLIGTQDGGADFLTSGIRDGGYDSNPAVVKATEELKKLHTDGYVNSDAFSGDYNTAATAFVQEDAAMIANGPWMVPTDIKGKNADKSLYSRVGYARSPGWSEDGQGLVVVAGNGGWVSGSRDERKQEAVVAFMKFLTSAEESLEQTRVTGAYPAVELKLTKADTKSLEPLAATLVKESTSTPYTYPHVYFAAPGTFGAAWKNHWPAYAKGEIDTGDFLKKLSEDSTSPTG